MKINNEKFNSRLTTINLIEENEKLYEGLIKSYPKTYVISKLSFILKKHPYHIKYALLPSENNDSLPYIKIEILKFNGDLIKEIYQHFTVCGWYPIYIIENGGKNLNNLHLTYIENNKEIKSIVFRAKYDTELERKYWPNYLYHIAPFSKAEKIIEQSLKPNTKAKLVKHAEHVYLFDYISDNDTYRLLMQLHKTRKNDINNNYIEFDDDYVIFKVNMQNQSPLFKLYIDHDLYNGYFTLNNISYYDLEVFKIINVNNLK